MKALHFADPHSNNKDIEEIEKSFIYIVEQAEKIKPDIIIFSGDLFNSRNIELDSKAVKLVFRIFSRLCMIAPVHVVIGTPSHDGKAAEVLRHIKGKYNIWVSEKPEQLYLLHDQICPVGEDDYPSSILAVISAIPAPTKQHFQTDSGVAESDEEIANAMSNIFSGFGASASQIKAPHIINGHFQIGSALISETQILTGRDIEISQDQISLANADLVCLGHIHYPQQIGKNIFYAGSIYRKTWGEMEEKGFYVHKVIGGFLPESTFLEIPTRKLIKFELDLTPSGAMDDRNEMITSFVVNNQNDLKDSKLKCVFTLFRDDRARINKKVIEDGFINYGVNSVSIDLVLLPRENVRSQDFLKLETLAEKLEEQAKIKDWDIPEGVIEKAELLESKSSEDIIKNIIHD